MLSAALVYGVTFLAVFGGLWLVAEILWHRLKRGDLAEQYMSDAWVKDVNTDR